VVADTRFPKLTNPASLREGALYSVSPQRPIGKRGAPLLVPAVGPGELDIPAVCGLGGSLLYFVDGKTELGRLWDLDFGAAP